MSGKSKRVLAILLAAAMSASTMTGCVGNSSSSAPLDTPESSKSNEPGDPFMKFDKPVEVHIGQQAYPTLKFPEGDTNENNVYTRYLLENFNIKIVVDWSAATGNDYNQKVNLCIASNTLPDGMQTDRKAMLAAAKSGMLYDFTEIFPKYASPQVLSIMNSGDGSAFDYSKYDGKQVSLVGVDVATSGQSMVNIRKDWLDKYGLEEPETLDDIENIAKVFKEKKPAGDGTIPIAGPDKNNPISYTNFLSPGVSDCGFEPVFAAYNAYPGYWVEGDDGKVNYGTLTDGSRKAFERLASWYKQGLIDPEMGVRDESDEAINSGKVGIYFCAWWKIGYGITDSYRNDPTANWQSYVVKSEDGKWNTREQCPVASYTIFNKKISEDVAKAAVIMNNVWIRDENKLTTSEAANTSIYWYPLRNSMGALDECEVTYKSLMQVMNGEKTAEDFNDPNTAMKLLYNDCLTVADGIKDYTKGSNELSIANFDITNSNFPRLYAILSGCRPSALARPDKSVYSTVYSQTPTMETKWTNLETAEKEMGLRIITGKDDIAAFDAFVAKWNAEGGSEILAEVQAMAGTN